MESSLGTSPLAHMFGGEMKKLGDRFDIPIGDTPMKILANLKEGDPQDPGSRKGRVTTGVLAVAVQEERRMALFFTGPKHAGENMEKLLEAKGQPSRCFRRVPVRPPGPDRGGHLIFLKL
jgi:hypothetical protein